MTTSRSIVRETERPQYTRYTPTNGHRPDGPEYGVDGWLFTLPGETLNSRRFPQATYAAYQVSEHGMSLWKVREVGGKRRQAGSGSTTRKGALALAVEAVAQEREKTAAASCWCGSAPCPMPIQHAQAQATCDAINQSGPAEQHDATPDTAAPALRDQTTQARGTAWRLAAPSAAGIHTAPTMAERLRQARAGWEATRPHFAQIRMAYPLAGRGASLYFLNREGLPTGDRVALTERGRAGAPNNPDGLYLDEITDGAMTEGLLIAAGWHLARKGYNYAPGKKWAPSPLTGTEAAQWDEWAPMLPEGPRKPAHAAVRIVMTPDHITYRQAVYGPVPELPALPAGMTAHSTQRGRWSVCLENRMSFDLTWQPVIGGERWTVWTGPNATNIYATKHTAPKAIEAIGELLADTDQED